MVKDVLRAEGVDADVREVLVADQQSALRLGFRGSPTIRVNGQDVAGPCRSEEGFALSCRLYPGSGQIGLPPADMVRRAVLQARNEGRHEIGSTKMKQGTGISASLGAIFSVLATLGCCLPFSFLAAVGTG